MKALKAIRNRGYLESLERRLMMAADPAIGGSSGPLGGIDVKGAGAVFGRKWADVNGNGKQDLNLGEQGLAGVVIYADLNHNGSYDKDEPATRSAADNPKTRYDEGGEYGLTNLPEGNYVIREVVPEGYRQTYPLPSVSPNPDGTSVDPDRLDLELKAGEVANTVVSFSFKPFCIRPLQVDVIPIWKTDEAHDIKFENRSGVQINGCGGDTTQFKISIVGDGRPHAFDLAFVDVAGGVVPVGADGEILALARIPVTINRRPPEIPGGHPVQIKQGTAIQGLDFGNQRTVDKRGSIEGRKWLDSNHNGQREATEPGLGGVTIYLDINRDGNLDRREPQTQTQYDNPVTDFDEGGLYQFPGIDEGEYVVREVVPRGFEPTYPFLTASVLSSETGVFHQGKAIDLDVTGIRYKSDGNQSGTAVDLTVVWQDGCGNLLRELTSSTVVGNHILVDMHGTYSGGLCPEVVTPQPDSVQFSNLPSGEYTVVATLHEQIASDPSAGPQARELTTLTVVGVIRIGEPGSHTVTVTPQQPISGIDFGNRFIGPGGSIQGTKWQDTNGDGQRQRGEPGLAGVTIYLDTNLNGQLDKGEPATKTEPTQDVDTGDIALDGSYRFDKLLPGNYVVREVVPEGYRQTFPQFIVPIGGWDVRPIDDLSLRSGGAHFVRLSVGEAATRLDFGNQPTTPGSILGTKWLDENGNGKREDSERGLEGVTIYADLNYNDSWDKDEPSAITEKDNPDTRVDEGGSYVLKGLKPGPYMIREVVPAGYAQTFPTWQFALDCVCRGGAHFVTVIPGDAVKGIDFGNQVVKPGAIHGTKWLDENGNGKRDDSEHGLEGVTIYVDLNNDGALNAGEPQAVSQKDDPSTRFDERGRYTISGIDPGHYSVREVVPQGYMQTFPNFGPWPLADGSISALTLIPQKFQGAHFVTVTSGGEITNIDFGNAEAKPGLIHGIKWLDKNANSRRDAGEPGLSGVTIFADQNQNGKWDLDEPSAVTQKDDPVTDFDETGHYWLKVEPGYYWIREVVPAGYTQTYPSRFHPWDPQFAVDAFSSPFPSGQHFVWVRPGVTVDHIDFGNRLNEKPIETPVKGPLLPGDIDLDGEVRFADFLLLANNFGKKVDAVFAAGDLDGNGEVGFADFLMLSTNFGKKSPITPGLPTTS